MNKRINFLSILLSMLIISSSVFAGGKTGLVVIGHGSNIPEWNKIFLDMEGAVKDTFNKRGIKDFDEIRVAMMEFTEPTIATVMKNLEKNGIEEVYVLPLFIAPSGHSRFDIPTILGMYCEKHKLNEIKSEGIEIVNSSMKITIGPELNYGDVLKEIMLDRVKELSENPAEEGVVLLSHGAEEFEPVWESMSRDIGAFITAKTSIGKFDYAFVEVGQSFMTNGLSTILNMASRAKRTIVIGLYISLGAGKIAEGCSISTGMMKLDAERMISKHNIVFSNKGLLPDKRIVDWIADRAQEWVESN